MKRASEGQGEEEQWKEQEKGGKRMKRERIDR